MEPSFLDTPGLRDFARAAILIGPGKTYNGKGGGMLNVAPGPRGFKFSRRRLEGILGSIISFLEEARSVAFDAARGKLPKETRLFFDMKHLDVLRPAEQPPGLLPMSNASEAMRWLRSAAGDLRSTAAVQSHGPVGSVVAEVEALMHKFYVEFVPCYATFGAAYAAKEEALNSVRLAEEAVALSRADDVGLVAASSGAASSTDLTVNTKRGRDQVSMLSDLGLTAAAPHVQSALELSARSVAQLLEQPPNASDKVAWAKYVEQLLATYLSAVSHVGKQLTALAKALPGNQMGKLLETSGPPSFSQVDIYQLVVAIMWIVKKDIQGDPAFDEVRKACVKGAAFTDMLAKWSPLTSGTSAASLHAAERRVVALWPRFGVENGSGGAELLLRRLYNWAAMAVALLPVLPSCQELAATHRSVAAAVAKLDELITPPAQDVWAEVRMALHGSGGEPWRWLQLIGCKDPHGFYKQHALQADGAPPVATPPANAQVAAASPGAAGVAAVALAEEDAPALPNQVKGLDVDEIKDDGKSAPQPAKPSSEGASQPSVDKAEPAVGEAAPSQVARAELAEAADEGRDSPLGDAAVGVAGAAAEGSGSAMSNVDGRTPDAAAAAAADAEDRETLAESGTADDGFEADRGEEGEPISPTSDATPTARGSEDVKVLEIDEVEDLEEISTRCRQFVEQHGLEEWDASLHDKYGGIVNDPTLLAADSFPIRVTFKKEDVFEEEEPSDVRREPTTDEFDEFEPEGDEEARDGDSYGFDKEEEEDASPDGPAAAHRDSYAFEDEEASPDAAATGRGFEDDETASPSRGAAPSDTDAENRRGANGFEPSYTAEFSEFEKDDFEEDEADEGRSRFNNEEFDHEDDFEPDETSAAARPPMKTDDDDDFEPDEPSAAGGAGQPSLEANYTTDFEEGAEDFEDGPEAADVEMADEAAEEGPEDEFEEDFEEDEVPASPGSRT